MKFLVIILLLISIPAHAYTLNGDVSYEESPELCINSLSVDNNWSRIPDWFAGTWQVNEATQYYSYDYINKIELTNPKLIKVHFTESWGMQRDKSGDVWHFDSNNINNDLGEVMDVFRVKNTQITTFNKAVIVRKVGTLFKIDKKTGALLSSNKLDSKTTYNYLTNNVIRAESYNITLNTAGEPLAISKQFWYSSKVSKFSPVYACAARNLIPLFYEFLVYNKLSHLIPEN